MTLSGTVSSKLAGETVTIVAKGSGQPTTSTQVTTTTGGNWTLQVQPQVEHDLPGAVRGRDERRPSAVSIRPRITLEKVGRDRLSRRRDRRQVDGRQDRRPHAARVGPLGLDRASSRCRASRAPTRPSSRRSRRVSPTRHEARIFMPADPDEPGLPRRAQQLRRQLARAHGCGLARRGRAYRANARAARRGAGCRLSRRECSGVHVCRPELEEALDVAGGQRPQAEEVMRGVSASAAQLGVPSLST